MLQRDWWLLSNLAVGDHRSHALLNHELRFAQGECIAFDGIGVVRHLDAQIAVQVLNDM